MTGGEVPERRVRLYNYLPLEYFSGGEISCSAIASALGKAGFKTEYVVDRGYHGLTRASPLQLAGLIRNFNYVRERFVRYFPALPPLFRKLPQATEMKSEDVHFVVLTRLPQRSFLKAATERRLKLVILLHGVALTVPHDAPRRVRWLQSFQSWYLRGTRRLLTSPGFHFQVFDEQGARSLMDAGISQSRIHIIPSGILFSAYPIPTGCDRFRVLFIGRMEVLTKGITLLRQVLDSMEHSMPSDMEILVVGTGRDSALFKHFASGSGKIRYLGFVDDARKKELLRTSALMLVTSYVEPFSLVTLEGIASGLPVLTTDVSGPRGILERDGRFGDILNRDPEAFVSAIMNYYARWKRNPAEYLQVKLERRKVGENIFDESRMTEKYVDLAHAMFQIDLGNHGN